MLDIAEKTLIHLSILQLDFILINYTSLIVIDWFAPLLQRKKKNRGKRGDIRPAGHGMPVCQDYLLILCLMKLCVHLESLPCLCYLSDEHSL